MGDRRTGFNSRQGKYSYKRPRLDAFEVHTFVCSVVNGNSFYGVSLLGNEGYCLTPSSVEVKKVWSRTSTMARPFFKVGCSVVACKMANET
jgi:hypothetical protein